MCRLIYFSFAFFLELINEFKNKNKISIQHFTTEEILQKHIPECTIINKSQAVELPKKGFILKSKSIQQTMKVPFVIYADFEALLESLEDKNKTHKHIACSYGYKVVCCYNNKFSKPFKMYRGVASLNELFKAIFNEEMEINKQLLKFKRTDMILTKQDKIDYENAKVCYVCKHIFTKQNRKVRDHCHVLGNYRGAACNTCNLGMKLPNTIPVVFHNFRGYDSHLLMQELGKFNKSINIIPNNMEKYMSFSVGNTTTYYDWRKDEDVAQEFFNLKFIDSYQFMPSSLAQLVIDLRKSSKDKLADKFKYSSEEFGKRTQLMAKKGIYPYSYMDC